MSLAMKRLQNIGWLALVFMVAILLYPLSLNVAAMHSNLVAVDRNILETKREISFLQAEIRTRASLQQLEEWNELLYGYQPPMANQFVSGEAALAELTVDLQATKPVMMASADIDAAPSANQANPAPTIEAVVKKSTEIATAVAAPIFAEPVPWLEATLKVIGAEAGVDGVLAGYEWHRSRLPDDNPIHPDQ